MAEFALHTLHLQIKFSSVMSRLQLGAEGHMGGSFVDVSGHVGLRPWTVKQNNY